MKRYRITAISLAAILYLLACAGCSGRTANTAPRNTAGPEVYTTTSGIANDTDKQSMIDVREKAAKQFSACLTGRGFESWVREGNDTYVVGG